ncbi:hypothetical protein [Robiginitalea marina]|uniref:DUF3379 domain-containing protein n=1 Tax=Robiginitalea marina TaxID=2954105 RepID=A0ABT1AUX8_9FLAO|nr:hypothetical protein [Robiginitalea marina]MCO5723816.1 hypothetical protein [Robiginitalea marina]
MKQNQDIENLFKTLEGQLDREEAPEGHRERFLQRLESGSTPGTGRGQPWWRHLSVAAAAVLLLAATAFLWLPGPSLEQQVAEISPEVSQTSNYFAGMVSRQVQELRQLESPQTRPLIEDTLKQLEALDRSYRQLEEDLLAGGNSKMILGAMIQNFQTRISLLQEVMKEAERVNQFKNQTHENSSL